MYINLGVTDSVAAKKSDLKTFLWIIINFVTELDAVLSSFWTKLLTSELGRDSD